ncbi:MAG: aldo/keto reductase [Spirochaetaceae bacterium]|jgi:predicted aldo/keto reductase-like oxidoreductase|nr:aldo/keto reductase [Spirochaetaceae bacterium]
MLYKEYGKTGKKLSVIGFGGMRFAKRGDDYDLDYNAEMMHQASRMGINYFDTAPLYYCDARSEEFFGQAFKNMPNEYYVSTKSNYKDGGELRRQLEQSLRRMDIPKINFFHIWCIMSLEDYRERLAKGGAYEAALKAKEEGLIDHIVASTHCNGEEIEIIANEGRIEGLTVGYNVLNAPYRQRGLDAAYKNNMGIVTMNPLSGGLIPKNPDKFRFICKDDQESVVDAALKFNAVQKEITVVLAGMDSLESVVQNAAVGNGKLDVPEETITAIKTRENKLLDQLCTGCQYCMPCPQGVEISKHMDTYNLKLLEDPGHKGVIEWYWGLKNSHAADCTACGICETKCTQHLNIIERLEEVSVW